MKKVSLGSQGLEVSRLGLGWVSAQWGPESSAAFSPPVDEAHVCVGDPRAIRRSWSKLESPPPTDTEFEARACHSPAAGFFG